MRTIIAALLIVVGNGSAANLGMPAISTLRYVPVLSAGWATFQYPATEDKLEVSGAALLSSSTLQR